MSCLEGSGGQPVRCRCCTQPWDGSSLVLGTMYSYDIFAAMPCCTERLKVNSLVLWFLNRSRTCLLPPPFLRKIIYVQFHFFPSCREDCYSLYSILSIVHQSNQANKPTYYQTDGIRWWNCVKLNREKTWFVCYSATAARSRSSTRTSGSTSTRTIAACSRARIAVPSTPISWNRSRSASPATNSSSTASGRNH